MLGGFAVSSVMTVALRNVSPTSCGTDGRHPQLTASNVAAGHTWLARLPTPQPLPCAKSLISTGKGQVRRASLAGPPAPELSCISMAW
jgi:hypothetical protein